MNTRFKNSSRHGDHKPANGAGRGWAFLAAIAVALSGTLLGPRVIKSTPHASAAGLAPAATDLDLYKRRVPDIHASAGAVAPRKPTAAQLGALDNLKAAAGGRGVTARWHEATGSVDVVFDFASAPSALDPESAARAFIASNAALFGIGDAGTLRLRSNVEALGGNLLYFEQVYQGLPVAGGGVGVVMDGQRRVRMASGPYYASLSLSTVPSLDGAAAGSSRGGRPLPRATSSSATRRRNSSPSTPP